jgi:3-hydroxyisobutyrate dehydrogenase
VSASGGNGAHGGRETVAVLGLGAMGHPIACRLAETGHPVRAWNRTPGRVQPGHPGITSAGSAQEAISGAAFVLLVLADDAALEQVLAGLAG